MKQRLLVAAVGVPLFIVVLVHPAAYRNGDSDGGHRGRSRVGTAAYGVQAAEASLCADGFVRGARRAGHRVRNGGHGDAHLRVFLCDVPVLHGGQHAWEGNCHSVCGRGGLRRGRLPVPGDVQLHRPAAQCFPCVRAHAVCDRVYRRQLFHARRHGLRP